eukprot:TRINITY_DN41956_c0_g1_i1.p1 TRINITY_DN41956_c0_g1~~TRINITY_DN41956_c0_g1_i1.p1  ORF type:complete len:327 (+),score=60.80 TRINITY_DN41956_c0_g1_i1:56-1036(+)
MGFEEAKLGVLFSAGCSLFWLIFLVVALPLSFQTLEQGQYALTLNWASQKLGDEEMVEPGLKYVGLGNMLVEFPSTFQTMYFVSDTRGIRTLTEGEDLGTPPIVRGPIRARSLDGLEMIVSVSFQWRLAPESLKPLYSILGDQFYKDEFIRFARAAVVESCSYFTADQFFVNRALITQRLLTDLSQNFKRPEKQLMLNIIGLQLREVDLPDDFDDEIANTQEQMQEVEVAIAEREEQVVRKTKDLLVSSQVVLERYESARAEAERVRLQNEAQVEQILLYQRKQAEANAVILQMLANETSPYDKLFELMEVRMLQGHQTGKLFMSM